MLEQYEDIIRNYDIEPRDFKKARNGILIETASGYKSLKELFVHEHKGFFLYELKEMLANKGFNVDKTLKTKEGCPFVKGEDRLFVLDEAVIGRELNLSDSKEIEAAVRIMARFHNASKSPVNKAIYLRLDKTGNLIENLNRHNAELVRIRNYIRRMQSWSDFDILFLKTFHEYYKEAQRAILAIKNDYPAVLGLYDRDKVVIHGQYNQHNLIYKDSRWHITNFEYSSYNLPVIELYNMLRKVLEKNNWDIRLGITMLESYRKEYQLVEEEYRLILNLLIYPEKFWKISNYYFGLNKAWKPQQTLIKLKNLIHQEENKKAFIECLENYIKR